MQHCQSDLFRVGILKGFLLKQFGVPEKYHLSYKSEILDGDLEIGRKFHKKCLVLSERTPENHSGLLIQCANHAEKSFSIEKSFEKGRVHLKFKSIFTFV